MQITRVKSLTRNLHKSEIFFVNDLKLYSKYYIILKKRKLRKYNSLLQKEYLNLLYNGLRQLQLYILLK